MNSLAPSKVHFHWKALPTHWASLLIAKPRKKTDNAKNTELTQQLSCSRPLTSSDSPEGRVGACVYDPALELSRTDRSGDKKRRLSNDLETSRFLEEDRRVLRKDLEARCK